MPRSRKWPVRHMSFWSEAQGRQRSGQGRRTVETTRSPAATMGPAGADSTTPRFSWPRTRNVAARRRRRRRAPGGSRRRCRRRRPRPRAPAPRRRRAAARARRSGGAGCRASRARPPPPSSCTSYRTPPGAVKVDWRPLWPSPSREQPPWPGPRCWALARRGGDRTGWRLRPRRTSGRGSEDAFASGLHRREIPPRQGPQRWTTDKAAVVFRDVPAGPAPLEVRLRGQRGPVTVAADGVVLGAVEPGAARGDLRPRPTWGRADRAIELRPPVFAAGDGRRLGALLDRVALRARPRRARRRCASCCAVPAARAGGGRGGPRLAACGRGRVRGGRGGARRAGAGPGALAVRPRAVGLRARAWR